MSRNERQKITSDKFRDNFDEIFGRDEEKPIYTLVPDGSIRVTHEKAPISKKNTTLDDS